MAGGKETPRQKMIGMMYLVLTALLAMNVSKQILQGYLAVNESVNLSKINLNENNKRITKAFENTINGNPNAKPYYDKAMEAEKLINETYKFIGEVRAKVVAETEPLANKDEKIADTLNLRRMDKIDDYDMPSHVLGIAEPKEPLKDPFTAYDMKMKLTQLHDKLITLVDNMQKDSKTKFLDEDYQGLKKKIGSIKPVDSGREEDGVTFNWEMDNFYHLPLAAVYTNLNKFQADLKNLEAEVLQVFSGASGKMSIKFDKLTAKVIAPSSYIQAGQEYKADIFLAASSSAMTADMMQVVVGADSATGSGGTPTPIEGGMGKYIIKTGGVGEQNYAGVIKFKKPDGSIENYPFRATYMVAAPSAAVALDKMNVFYIGVENPISVSAGGVAPTDLQVSGTGGIKLTPKGAGKFVVTASAPGEATINVSAKTKDGTKPQGSFKFRVKKIPDPVTKVGGKSGNVEMKRADLSKIGGVLADLPGFDFEAKFIIVSYELSAVVKGALKTESVKGNQLSSGARDLLSKCGSGAKVFFDEVKAKGPDGSIRSIPGVTIKVK